MFFQNQFYNTYYYCAARFTYTIALVFTVCGLIFWFTLNKLTGSYFAFISASLL